MLFYQLVRLIHNAQRSFFGSRNSHSRSDFASSPFTSFVPPALSPTLAAPLHRPSLHLPPHPLLVPHNATFKSLLSYTPRTFACPSWVNMPKSAGLPFSTIRWLPLVFSSSNSRPTPTHTNVSPKKTADPVVILITPMVPLEIRKIRKSG